jgi:hypothetical protein
MLTPRNDGDQDQRNLLDTGLIQVLECDQMPVALFCRSPVVPVVDGEVRGVQFGAVETQQSATGAAVCLDFPFRDPGGSRDLRRSIKGSP